MKRIIGISAMFLMLVIMTTSCNKEDDLLTGEGTEMNEGSGGEGNESGGENGEGNGGEGGNESGMLWSCTGTADETVNGIRLKLSYDAATESFTGTLENINTVTTPQVRVEVHVFDAAGNSTEYGPTTPADMTPGEMRNVTLSVAGITDCFQFNMHPEVGSGGEGNEGGGGEGNEGGGGEGNEGGGGEGNEGGGGGELGNESGLLWNKTELADETVNGIRLKLSYDAAIESFTGTLENINTVTTPQVRVEVHVFDAAGNSTEYGPTTPADMAPGEIRNVVLPTPGAGNFVNFNMHPEVG